MATHMLRQFARRAVYAHPLLRRQSVRLVSSSPRVIFAGNKCLQQPFLVSSSLAAKPPSLMGVRLFADAGAALSREEIQTRVMDVLKLFDKVEPEKLTIKSHFINDLGLDSLDIVEIVMALEDDFAIEISDEEAEKVFTVDDAVQLIAKALDEH